MDGKDDENEHVNDGNDSCFMDDENSKEEEGDNEECDGIIDARPPGQPVQIMDHDDILIEVMNIAPSKGTVSSMLNLLPRTWGLMMPMLMLIPTGVRHYVILQTI